MISQRVDAPIVGYRVWVADRGRLRSATTNDFWPGGVIEAHCGEHETHQAPAPACGCGIYVCDSKETALRYRDQRRRRPWLWGEEVVVGAVQLWGGPGRPVIVGEIQPDFHGRTGLQYRAPYARIVALEDGPGAGLAGRALGVPVVRPGYLEAFAREVGGVQLQPPPARRGGPGAGTAPGATGRPEPPAEVALRALGRFSWLFLRWSVKIAWWTSCQAARLAALALVAIVGHALSGPAPRRHW